MKIRKFTAADMKDALGQIKKEMGPDAMIVATRQVRRGLVGTGIEVTAAIDVDDDSPSENENDPPPQPARSAGLSESDIERLLIPLRAELRSLRAQLRPSENNNVESLRSELAALRKQLSHFDGARATDETIQQLDEPQGSIEELLRRYKLTAPSERRVVALVGPTGVGKTTTIAKLAARAALIQRLSVHIVTLDNYRVGGEEQIRAFADLMGVPVTLVTDPAKLASIIAGLQDADRVFIDTAGRSPRDVQAIASLERALSDVPDLEVHLALSAATPAHLIDTIAQRYKSIGIDRILFTKLDETDQLDQIVRAPARIGRPITYLTTGQRVPEDLEEATPKRLGELARAGYQSTAQGATGVAA